MRNGVPSLFLFGHERSGTTLLSMIVGAHPQLAVPLATTGLWYDFADRLDAYGRLERQADLERLVDDLLASERIRLWDAPIGREEVLEGLPRGDYAAVVQRFHACYARHKGKPYWGNIDIATLDEMDKANAWFPDALFVHIVRDARDVALSNQTMPYSVGNMLECAEKWSNRLYANLKMGAILGEGRYHVLRYEDLVLEPETTLQSLCGFIGIPYDAAMLNYPEMVDDKVPDNRRFLWPELSSRLQPSKVYRWKRELGERRRLLVEDLAGDMLRRLDYEVDAAAPKSVGAFLLGLWYFADRGERWQRLLGRLGLRRKSRLEREWEARKQTGTTK